MAEDAVETNRRVIKRQRIAAGIMRLAAAIDRGEVVPLMAELEAAVAVCEAYDLPAEAARIRRWLTP